MPNSCASTTTVCPSLPRNTADWGLTVRWGGDTSPKTCGGARLVAVESGRKAARVQIRPIRS
jgi:hypothetical protein